MCWYILPLLADTITPVQQGIFVTWGLCQIQGHTKHSIGLQSQGHMAEICSLQVRLVYYAPPLIGGGIKRCFCLTSDVYLTSVCRVHRA